MTGKVEFKCQYEENKCKCRVVNNIFSIGNKKKNSFPVTQIFAIHHQKKKKGRSESIVVHRVHVRAKKVVDYVLVCRSAGKNVLDLRAACLNIPASRKKLAKSSRSMLVVINPVSGNGKGKTLYEKTIRPILEKGHLKISSVVTERQGHAIEILKKLDLTKFNEVGVVGGDGLYHEVLQGLFNHPKLSYKEIRKICISIFPAGTGNAMGVISDVEFKYPCLDWMGDGKYVIASVLRILARTYYGVNLRLVKLKKQKQSPKDKNEFPVLSSIFSPGKDGKDREIKIGKHEPPPIPHIERHFAKELKELMKPDPKKNKKKKKKNDDDDYEEIGGESENVDSEEKSDEEEKESEEQSEESEEEEEEESEEEEGESDESEEEKEKEESESEEEIEVVDEEQVEIEIEEEEEKKKKKKEKGEDDPSSKRWIVKEFKDPMFYLYIGQSQKLSYDIWGGGSSGNGWIEVINCTKNLYLCGMVGVFMNMMAKTPKHLDDNRLNHDSAKAFCFQPTGKKVSIMNIDGEKEKLSPAVIGEIHPGVVSIMHAEKELKDFLDEL